MVCRLAFRFGGLPSEWAELDPIYLHTMTRLANESDQQRRRT